MRLCGRRRADVCRYKDVAFEQVAPLRHISELHRNSYCGHRSVCIGNESDSVGTRAYSAETSDYAYRWCAAARVAAFCAVEPNFDKVRALACGAGYGFDGYIFRFDTRSRESCFYALARNE